MNYKEIVSLAKDMGLNDSRARVAAAIAMAESGGNPNAVVHDSDDDSYGLWQINMKDPMGSDRRRKYGLPNNEALLDPRRNGMVMADLSQHGGNFSAWTTYTSGKYKEHMDGKSLADKAADIVNGAKDAAGNAYNNAMDVGRAAGTIANATEKTAKWVSDSKTWVRIAYVGGGTLVIIVASVALLRSTPAGSKAVSAVSKRTKQAVKVAKKVK
jgi:hypothetical protein